MVCYKIIDLKWKDVRQIISTKIWFNNLKIGCFTPMAREPRSTSTFTPGLSYIDSISFTLVFARKNYVMEISSKKIFFFKRTTVAQKLTFCSHTNSCLRVDDLPASCTFFFRWIVLKQSLEEEGGGGGGGGSWSRIPAPFSRETRIPLFFPLLFPKATTTTTEKKYRASVWFALAVWFPKFPTYRKKIPYLA